MIFLTKLGNAVMYCAAICGKEQDKNLRRTLSNFLKRILLL